MKTAIIIPFLAAGVSAFSPSSLSNNQKIGSKQQQQQLSMSDGSSPVDVEIEDKEPAGLYPKVNGWTADPTKFCLGLPGAIAPLGDFDPLGFTTDKSVVSVQEIKRYREAEVTHGRVAMLATLGYLVAEPFHPLFNGQVTGPANSHLGQVQEVAPFFFAFLTTSIAVAELFRATTGWESPVDAVSKNKEIEGKTWLSKLNDDYYPGDIGFDPLGLKPTDPVEFAEMQTKELSNGRLAMLAAMGMIVQEQVTGSTLF